MIIYFIFLLYYFSLLFVMDVVDYIFEILFLQLNTLLDIGILHILFTSYKSLSTSSIFYIPLGFSEYILSSFDISLKVQWMLS